MPTLPVGVADPDCDFLGSESATPLLCFYQQKVLYDTATSSSLFQISNSVFSEISRHDFIPPVLILKNFKIKTVQHIYLNFRGKNTCS